MSSIKERFSTGVGMTGFGAGFKLSSSQTKGISPALNFDLAKISYYSLHKYLSKNSIQYEPKNKYNIEIL